MEEEKVVITPRVLSQWESVAIKTALATQHSFALQKIPAIQQAISIHQEILKTFDFSAFIRSVEEAQRSFIEFQKNFSIFSAPKREMFFPTREKSREVVIVKEISEQQEDRIADKVFARLQIGVSDGSDRLHLNTNNKIINIPKNASWESITIAFESPQEVTVCFKDNFVGRFSYDDLGFHRENTKLKRPNMAWGLLLILANSMEARKASIQDILSGGYFKKIEAIHTSRSALSKQLKKSFGISESPFYSYKQEGGYKTKFKLVPTSDMRHEELHMQSGSQDLREIDYLV